MTAAGELRSKTIYLRNAVAMVLLENTDPLGGLRCGI